MLRSLIALCAALLAAPAALAQQSYPQKPIRYIVPFPAGGIADVFARIIGGRIAEAWGQPVVVENRAGAGGNIGADFVAKAPPDGYTILMGSIGTQALNASLYRNMPYDSAKDFTPVALVIEAESLLALHPSVGANTPSELIALARSQGGKLTCASAGVGTTSHLACELFKSMARVDVTHVPYKGNVPAITDLLGGQTSMLFATMPTVLPHVKAGKLKGIAVLGGES
jgi:tripartite-type tricarboxylate transporter receptor subunit TctC